ncbi:uncharacterized protein SETTUDRAFT_36613 [Exserohilum turcica Et28A]|uniref:Uncharacterized protein n=1 Tax=Exserohilum turcicum (strain 28A) TaxID=671987 RepID=R0KTR9_EXST2|nr:uncharacterized protein SETTUDRAFT_36613 [Exserohilum turcica Et28A]EOA91132.1 hypothetical protein SETTUDRAFT_36613 [Exserohilum turcica Et28A]
MATNPGSRITTSSMSSLGPRRHRLDWPKKKHQIESNIGDCNRRCSKQQKEESKAISTARTPIQTQTSDPQRYPILPVSTENRILRARATTTAYGAENNATQATQRKLQVAKWKKKTSICVLYQGPRHYVPKLMMTTTTIADTTDAAAAAAAAAANEATILGKSSNVRLGVE